MRIHRITIFGALALVALFALFLFFAHQADQAMDKSGMGNLAKWEFFGARAGFSFWSFVSLWVIILGIGLRSTGTTRSQLFLLCAFSLLMAVILWAFTLVFA